MARQCGTSIAMIEQHYSHVVPSMFEQELSGVTFEQIKEEPSAEYQKHREYVQEALARQYQEWAAEYKRRGCI